MPVTTEDLTLPALRAAYAAGRLTPTALARELLPAIAASRAVFISRPSDEEVLQRCRCADRLVVQAGGRASVRRPADGAERMPPAPAPARRLAALLPRRAWPPSAVSWRRSPRTSGARCGACPLR